MSKLMISGLCGLMLAVTPPAWAAQRPAKQSPEEAKRTHQGNLRFGQCLKEAQSKGLKPNTREFDRFLGQCTKR